MFVKTCRLFFLDSTIVWMFTKKKKNTSGRVPEQKLSEFIVSAESISTSAATSYFIFIDSQGLKKIVVCNQNSKLLFLQPLITIDKDKI